MFVINKHFSKRAVIQSNLSGWLNLKYGKRFLFNLYCIPIDWFTGLHIHHLPQPYLKSNLANVWDIENELLEATSSHRFRNQNDVSQSIFRFFALCQGKFVPRKAIGAYYDIGTDHEQISKSFHKQSKKMICINDTLHDVDVDVERCFLQELFEKIFPEKSSFEK